MHGTINIKYSGYSVLGCFWKQKMRFRCGVNGNVWLHTRNIRRMHYRITHLHFQPSVAEEMGSFMLLHSLRPEPLRTRVQFIAALSPTSHLPGVGIERE